VLTSLRGLWRPTRLHTPRRRLHLGALTPSRARRCRLRAMVHPADRAAAGARAAGDAGQRQRRVRGGHAGRGGRAPACLPRLGRLLGSARAPHRGRVRRAAHAQPLRAVRTEPAVRDALRHGAGRARDRRPARHHPVPRRARGRRGARGRPAPRPPSQLRSQPRVLARRAPREACWLGPAPMPRRCAASNPKPARQLSWLHAWCLRRLVPCCLRPGRALHLQMRVGHHLLSAGA